MRYQVFATRWDDPKPIDEIPARNLEFSMPLSDHGECSFSATVDPGSTWRQDITQYLSGVLICRDDVPVWQGWVIGDEESGDRTFTFRAIEWGYFFTKTLLVPKIYTNENDAYIFRNLIDLAQLVSGQDVQVDTGDVLGATVSTLTLQPWDIRTVEEVFRRVGTGEESPDWYVGTTGTRANPVRQLYVGDFLGLTSVASDSFLEFVEQTAPPEEALDIPTVALLGDLFPGAAPIVPTRRAGGNVIAKRRTRNGESATVAVVLGNGQEAAQKRGTATSGLLAWDWPRMTSTRSFESNIPATLNRLAKDDLKKAEGFATGYSLVTLDGDPEWPNVPRGSTLGVSIDTDVYAGPRPLEFETRLLNLIVRVPDTGAAQVQWDVATVQET